MGTLLQDLRYAARTFRKSPVFVVVAILSLALGIGANTAIFTLIDQVLLRLLPVKDPEQLVLLWGRGPHYGIEQRAPQTFLSHVRGFPRSQPGVQRNVVLLGFGYERQLGRADRTRPRRARFGNLLSGSGRPSRLWAACLLPTMINPRTASRMR